MNQEKNNKEIEEWKKLCESKIYNQELHEKSKKRVKIFSNIISHITKFITSLSIGTFIAIFIAAFVLIYAYFYIALPKNVLKSLEELYDGEKFEIVEDFGAKNGHSRGLYIVSPKKNKNIQFKMYNTNQVRSDNDYSAQRTKYYIEHCEDKELLNGIQIEEFTFDYKDVEFLHYTLKIEVKDYNELDEAVEKAYKLAKYLHSQDPKMFESIFLNLKNLGASFITIPCDTENTLEEEINRAKQEYLKALEENNK